MSAAERWIPADPDTGPDVIEYRGDPADVIEAQDALLTAIRERPAWHAQAACRGMGNDKFFPPRGERTADARAICQGCPVRGECLDAGLDEGFGIWGGFTRQERQLLRRGRTIEDDSASPTDDRPSASTVGAGAQWYDATLRKPIWSDGSQWRDAAGVIITESTIEGDRSLGYDINQEGGR